MEDTQSDKRMLQACQEINYVLIKYLLTNCRPMRRSHSCEVLYWWMVPLVGRCRVSEEASSAGCPLSVSTTAHSHQFSTLGSSRTCALGRCNRLQSLGALIRLHSFLLHPASAPVTVRTESSNKKVFKWLHMALFADTFPPVQTCSRQSSAIGMQMHGKIQI